MMGGSSGGSSMPSFPSVPSPPGPGGYSLNVRGSNGKAQKRTNTYYSGKKKKYITNTYLTKEEERQQQERDALASSYLSQLGTFRDTNKAKYDTYEQDFVNRMNTALDEEYNKGLRQTDEAFNASGFLKSTGYEDYRRKNLDEILSKGKADSAAQGRTARSNFEMQDQQAILNSLASLFGQSGALTAQQGNFGQMGLQGAGFTNDYLNNNWLNQLRFNREAMANRMAQQQAQQSGGGFWQRAIGY